VEILHHVDPRETRQTEATECTLPLFFKGKIYVVHPPRASVGVGGIAFGLLSEESPKRSTEESLKSSTKGSMGGRGRLGAPDRTTRGG